MKWVVAIPCIQKDFLSRPADFLMVPQDRGRSIWACGLIEAANEDDAYVAGDDAWTRGELSGPQPSDYFPINSYVAPLTDVLTTAAQSVSATAVAAGFRRPRVCECGPQAGRELWLVAVAWVSPDFLSQPRRFLEHPASRAQPQWSCGVVRAADESAAFLIGEDAWMHGLLSPAQDPAWIMNWYAQRMPPMAAPLTAFCENGA